MEGILKISWLQKHCEQLPSLVAFFFDLDWNDPQWDERQMECVSKVEVIRSVRAEIEVKGQTTYHNAGKYCF